MSLARPELECQYTYEDGMWVFHNRDEIRKYHDVGIIFDKGGSAAPYDTLLKCGDWCFITEQFNDRFQAVSHIMDLRIVWVPPSEIETLNNAIAISASKWCTTLENNVKIMEHCIIINDENGE